LPSAERSLWIFALSSSLCAPRWRGRSLCREDDEVILFKSED